MTNQIFPIQKETPAVPGVVMVKRSDALSKGSDLQWQKRLQSVQASSVEPTFRWSLHKRDQLSDIQTVHIPEASDVYRAAESFLKDPSVIWAEPVYKRSLMYTPNDPQIDSQWYIDQIQCREAWDIFRGDTSIIIGIVDTGVEIDHPDLRDNIWINPNEIPGNGVDDDGNGYIDDVHGWDFASEDNNPRPSTSVTSDDKYHGTATAGAASAVTDNGLGIAGPAFNARIMALKAAADTEDQYIIYGFKAIAYAAENGARVINCSFGGEGASNAEREIVAYAYSLGSVVIAAAGNENTKRFVYPASYQKVLSVGATGSSDTRVSFSNYGPAVDLMAPGYRIYSTNGENGYASFDGTSFSAPITAGVAALLFGYHPNWTGEQVREQVRISADPIDQINMNYAGQLGSGRLNAYRALAFSSPSIRMDSVQLSEKTGNQDGFFEPGETVSFDFRITNYLEPATGVLLSFTTDNPDIEIQNGHISVGDLGVEEAWEQNSSDRVIRILPTAVRGRDIFINLSIQADGYQDRDYFILPVAPDYKNLSGGDVTLTISSTGRIGYVDYPENFKGVGFVYQGDENLLFEGAFMAAVSPDSVSDVARGEDQSYQNEDFLAISAGDVQITTDSDVADMEGVAVFSDREATHSMNIQVTQESYAFASDAGYVLIRYEIQPQAHSLRNFYTGLFVDWDAGDNGQNAGNNLPGYDADRRLAYVYDPHTGLHGGMCVFNGSSEVNYHPIKNEDEIYDGYTDAEKWAHLSSGVQASAQYTEADYANVLGIGPADLSLGDTLTFGYAILAGANLNALIHSADAASVKWHFLNTALPESHDFPLLTNYPSPFNGSTQIRYGVPENARVEISIYDVMGRKCVSLLNLFKAKDTVYNDIHWDGRNREGELLPSGVYFIAMRYQYYLKVNKTVIIR